MRTTLIAIVAFALGVATAPLIAGGWDEDDYLPEIYTRDGDTWLARQKFKDDLREVLEDHPCD